MPTPALKSFSQKSGKPLDEVERLWKKAKRLARKEGFTKKDDSYYAYVTGILKRMLGISEYNKLEEYVSYLLGDDYEIY